MSWDAFYQANLRWPTGGIWSNLLASLLLGVPTIVLGWRKIKQHLSAHYTGLLERVEQAARSTYSDLDRRLGDALPDWTPDSTTERSSDEPGQDP